MTMELPGDYVAPGPEFDYTQWTAGTRVTLCNVPWDSSYRDVYKANSRAELDEYLNTQTGPTITLDDLTYARVGAPVEIDIPFNVAYRYNYIRVNNPAQPIQGDFARSYYYFITDVIHTSPSTTTVLVQLDVFQTFIYEIRFGNCFIERGHVGIANENQFRNFGRDFLTVPEGLDIGGEMVIAEVASRKVATARTNTIGDTAVSEYQILVVSNVDFTADLGDMDNPKMVSANGNMAENLPNGAEMYVFGNVYQFKAFLERFKENPLALQGIVDIVAIPSVYQLPRELVNIGGMVLARVAQGVLATVRTPLKQNWRNSLDNHIPLRYRHLQKFKTAPYTMLELTSNTGTPVALKPESWQDEHATVNEIPHFASSGSRLVFSPNNYNAKQNNAALQTDEHGFLRDAGEFLDVATMITNFPHFSIVNDGYMQYLAANKNSIAYSHSSADWSQQRALGGNQLAYDQASNSMATQAEANRLGVNASYASNSIQDQTAIQSTALNAVNSIGRGMAGGPAGIAGGIASAATAGLSTAIDINSRNQQLGVSAGLANAQTANALGNAGYMRDTNKGFADYAARGDYQNQIAGIQAKVQDATVLQPTTAGQVGGDAFLLARYRWGYDLKIKTLDPGAMASIGEYWLRYGYQVNRFGKMPESLKCMSHFTYWKIRESYILGSACPETFKQTIRGIFEKGVTVWSNPTDMGRIDNADNKPLEGIVL